MDEKILGVADGLPEGIFVGTVEQFSAISPNGKEPPFPVKLHCIFSNPEYSDLVSWLPHS